MTPQDEILSVRPANSWASSFAALVLPSLFLTIVATSWLRGQSMDFVVVPPDPYSGIAHEVRVDMWGEHGENCVEFDINGNCITYDWFSTEGDQSTLRVGLDGAWYPSWQFPVAWKADDSGCQYFDDGTWECWNVNEATGWAAFAPGAHRLDADATCEGEDCYPPDLTTNYTFTRVVPTARGVAVRAELPERQHFAGAAASPRFFVKNRGNIAASYTVSWQCTGAISGCAVSPTTLSLSAGESRVVTLTYAAGSAGGSATAMVKAVDNAASLTRDSATVTVRAIGAPFPLVSVVDGNPGTTIERHACLAIAAGSSAAFECGDLRIVHQLPAIRTLNKARIPTLLYNSAHADPYPVVAASATLATGSALPDSVEAVLTVGGAEKARGRWAGSDWTPGATRRLALGYSAASDTTGVYDYTFEVATIYLGTPGSRNGTAVTGKLIVVNRRSAAFGAGWWLAGLERLKPLADGSQLWVGGDGSARVYASMGANLWVAAKFDRPDTLKKVQTGQYYRVVPGGAKVWFSAGGKHDSTVNRLGHRTNFTYADTFLTTITLPPQGGSQVYGFTYDSVSLPPPRRIVSVAAPGGRTTTVWLGSQRVDSIRDPDTRKIRFSYEDASSRRIATRTDRRGTVTSYSYDAAKKLWRAHVNLQPDSIRVGFRARDVQGLVTALPKTATDTAVVYTAHYGARQFTTGPNYILQETRFWLDAYGAPRRIRNVNGDSTLIRREDGDWPALATTLTAPNSFVTQAWYDGRGNIARSIAVNPLGNGQDAPTRYHWDQAWDFVDSIVTPSGVVTTMVYDPTTGNRQWQLVGNDPARGVIFRYDNAPLNLLSSTTLPQTPPDAIIYDAQGNVRAVGTPKSFWTSYYKDALGRDTLVVTPIDSTDTSRGGAQDSTARQRQRTVYTVMDQDSIIETIAPNRVETVRVDQRYDSAGNLLSLARVSVPDPTNPPIGTITTRWRYDRANRRVAEVAPDGYVDSTGYDPAGNVVSAVTRRKDPTSGARLTISMSYDALNRLATRGLPPVNYPSRPTGFNIQHPLPVLAYPAYPLAAETHQFTYDQMGRLLTADNQDARIKRSYFPNGLIKTDSLRIQTVARDDWEQHKYGLRYAYDLDGRRDSLFIPHQLRAGSDTVIAYTYDPQLGLLQTLRDLQSNRYDVSYTLRGELRSILYPAQYSEVLSYDADGRLQADTIRNPGPYTYPPFFNVTLARATRYSYDAQGRVLRSGDPLRFKDTLDVEYTGLGHLRRSHLSQWGCAQYCYFEGDRYATAEVYEQDALANRTYGVVSDTTGVSPRNPTWHDAFWVYVPGSGRLTEEAPGVGLPHRHFEYDSSGNNVFSYALSTAAPSTERASFFAADGSLRQVDSRWAVSLAAGDGQEQRYAVEDYRYDALGRRVWLRARKWCEGNWYDWRAGTECSTGLLRRTIWDGERELAEIQMPWALQNHGVGSAGSDDTTQQRSWWENDDTVPVNLGTLALDAYPPADPNPYFGHVIYSGQRGIDQPLAITRVNYVQALDWDPPRQARYKVWGPSTIVPFWNARGDAPQGIYSNGAFILCDPPTSTVTCVALEWPYVWSAYDRQQRPSAQEYWQGTLLEGKRDKSGFDYRRNRYYDPTTGRFTQEDPVGLAGGINLYGFAKGDPVNFADPFGLKPCPGRLKKLAGRLQMLAFKIVQYRNSYRRGIADQDHFDRIKDEQDGLNKDLDAYHRDDCDDDDNDFRRLRNQAMSFSREKLPEPQMRYGPQRDYMQVLVPGFGIAPGLTPTVPEFPVFEVPPFPVFEVPIVTVFP